MTRASGNNRPANCLLGAPDQPRRGMKAICFQVQFHASHIAWLFLVSQIRNCTLTDKSCQPPGRPDVRARKKQV